MPDSYLDQLWSRYHASPEPGMSSLYRTCLAFTKHVLQPSHIIPLGGGFTLLPDLADPLPHVISGVNSVLRLAAQEHRLCRTPSIGTSELNVLTATSLHLLSTQNQVVHSWVILIDRLAAAMRDIEYLCIGDPLHLLRYPWTSRIPSILVSLPPSLRIKLPVEFLRTHGIVVPCAANASTMLTQTRTVMPRVTSPPLHASATPPSSVVSLETLAERVKSIAGMTSLHSSHIVGAQRINGRCTLDSRVFNSVEKTVHDLQSELTKTLSSSSPGFLVDPHGILLQTLRGSSSIGELSVAWTALQRRMSLALNRLVDYQSKLQDSCQQTGSASVDMHTLAHDECRSACCTDNGMNRGTLLDVRKAHHPSVKATVAAIEARERAVTKTVTCREPHGRASCEYVLPSHQSPAPANEIAHAAMVELGGQRQSLYLATQSSEVAEDSERLTAATDTSRTAPASSPLAPGRATPVTAQPSTAASHPRTLPARLRVTPPSSPSGFAPHVARTNGGSAVMRIAPPPKSPAPAPATADTVELGGLRIETTQPQSTASASKIECGGLTSAPLQLKAADTGRDTWQAVAEVCRVRSRLAEKSRVAPHTPKSPLPRSFDTDNKLFVLVSTIIRTRSITYLLWILLEGLVPRMAWEREGIGTATRN